MQLPSAFTSRQRGRSVAAALALVFAALPALVAAAPEPFHFTRMLAHWAGYATDDYLAFVDEAEPELVQHGFYGAHFWSLAHTPQFGGYPAHLPVRGLRQCRDWFQERNAQLHRRGVKVIGHFNIEFLVGDPSSDAGPRGFFAFYDKLWDEDVLGPKPDAPWRELLERDADGEPIVHDSYKIGGMREYWACLRSPAWQQVLKAWIRAGIDCGLDGFVINYFYRHNCLCEHCTRAFRAYLGGRFTAAELQEQFGIGELATHVFDEIVSWHDPEETSPLRLQMLRFSQLSNKQVFDELFIDYGRSLKPDLIVAQWNHLGNFSQVSGDERCLLPGDRWGAGETYLWYSTGGAACYSDLSNRFLGDATLQARYIRGAFQDKPYTLGKYEITRVRMAIAELAANGGAPMGFYTRFSDPLARREIVRYYQFLKRYDDLYHGNRPYAEVALLYPRSRVHQGDVAAVAAFRERGRQLLEEHVLFDVVPDDLATAQRLLCYRQVVRVDEPAPTLRAGSRFNAPWTVRVAASRPRGREDITVHLVNYNREEPPPGRDGKPSAGRGIAQEKPLAAPAVQAELRIPQGRTVAAVEVMTPEAPELQTLPFVMREGRVCFEIPPFLVYAVANVHLRPVPKVAAITTVYRYNSHADVIVGRLLQSDTMDGGGRYPKLHLVSLYTDQVPDNDLSRDLARQHGFQICDSVAEALLRGGDTLAVDGVLLIAEHGKYPESETGQFQFPKRRLFDEIVAVFQQCGQVVPVFVDKHLADNWTDAKHIYDTAARLGIPLLAGSSLPVLWRRPPADVDPDRQVADVVAVSYGRLDAYGFHALEMVQSLVEQRRGGETGISSVRCLEGEAVWTAGADGLYDRALLDAALGRLQERPLPAGKTVEALARRPVLFLLRYQDGLRAAVLTLNGAVAEWAVAWRYRDADDVLSTLFWTQERRPFYHFTFLVDGIEALVHSGKAPWPVERTLLTSGALDALLTSRLHDGEWLATPHLDISYVPGWRWREPPPPRR